MTKKATRAQGAHIPADYDLPVVSAMQALLAGEADEHQQKLALQWIIEQAAGTYEFQYYPSERDTAFALGRAHVGQQIVKLLKLNTMTLRRGE
jgi:hypothetical protein